MNKTSLVFGPYKGIDPYRVLRKIPREDIQHKQLDVQTSTAVDDEYSVSLETYSVLNSWISRVLNVPAGGRLV